VPSHDRDHGNDRIRTAVSHIGAFDPGVVAGGARSNRRVLACPLLAERRMSAKRRSLSGLLLLAAFAGGVALAGAAGRAQACGGFFCNQPNGPNDQPVAQTAENVLFAMDRAPSGQYQLTAHIQIFYTGPADRFSWVVPVDSEPKLGVGSNAVFTALLGATQPRFQLEWREVGTCRESTASPPALNAPPPSPPPAGSSAADAGSGPGVAVAFRGDVGPYDAAVIKSTDRNDPKPLVDWLIENKYFVSPEATRLIEQYVREDKYFVAIRLLAEKGVSEIQPLTMKFLGPGPCVPLRLTAIASIRDLGVNLWVLADSRVVPENYYEMEINPARIDWFRNGSNYADLVKQAADQAGGNAFITEYAGPTTMFRGRLFQAGRYNLEGIRQAPTPPDALDQIAIMGFSRDTLLLNILRTHIPMPERLKAMGIDERTFYNQLRLYWNQYRADFKPWDPAALAADLDAKIVAPLREVQELFDSHAKLTRLATFISPEEMNVDPTFVVNPTLPDVPVVRTAVATRACGNRQYDRCTAPVRLEAPGVDPIWFLPQPQSSQYCYGSAGQYNRAQVDQMPALYRAWARDSVGEGAARVDMRELIASSIRAHNVSASGVRRLPGIAPGTVWPPPPEADESGCGCRLGGAHAGLPALLLPLAVGLGLIARRRRARSPR
jgi:hypothetical protein